MNATAEHVFNVTHYADLTVIHLPRTIRERERILEFTDELIAYCEMYRPAKVQINFEYVEFFGTEAISALLRAQRRINEYGGKMNLCGLSSEQRRIFRICRLDGQVFEIHDECRDSVAALGS